MFELPNRDPRDLARGATVTASSERTIDGEGMTAENVINGYARAAAERTNAWRPDPGRAMPQWVELAWGRAQTFNVVHVTFLTRNHAPDRFAVQAWHVDAWKTLAELATGRYRRHVLGLDRVTTSRLRVVLLDSERGEPGVCEIRVYDEPERIVEIARRAAENMQLPDARPDLPWDDGVLWVTGVDPRKLAGIVLDDTQAETTGRWVHSDYSKSFVGEGYAHDGDADKGAKSMRFTLRPPEAGTYELRIAYSAFDNRTTNAPVAIHTSRGSRTVRVNQRVTPPLDGLFLPLGTFELEAGETVRVEITNDGTDGYVVVDALQLVPAGDAGPPAR